MLARTRHLLMQSRRALNQRIGQYRSVVNPEGARVPPLPPVSMRMGGANSRSDEDFLRRGREDVERLRRWAGLDATSVVLDIGCGPARLAIGLICEFGEIGAYEGVEIQQHHVQWATRHITKRWPSCRFTYVDVRNERYNPNGRLAEPYLGSLSSVDVMYFYSVFTHMRGQEVATYLAKISERLEPGGKALFTVFVEPEVEGEAVNPPGYADKNWSGALHCVRFNQELMEQMISDAGLAVTHFEHRTLDDSQSFYVVSPK